MNNCNCESIESCCKKEIKIEITEVTGPFGRDGQPLFIKRGVAAGGKIIGVEI